MRRSAAAALLAVLAAACAPNPKYVPPAPAAPAPAAFKENANWRPAQPADAVLKGHWWELFGDPQLNALEQQIDVSNQNLKIIAAQFEQARQAVRASRSNLFPQVSTAPAVVRTSQSATRVVPAPSGSYGDFLVPVDVTWEADIWGRLRSALAAARAGAQASAGDVESLRLSLHAELAVDYFTLRGVDADEQLLARAVESYAKALELTRNRFQGGLAAAADVALAETQLETTRAQSVDVTVARANLEHAIAVLTGQNAAALSLPPSPLAVPPPIVPAGLPAQLLERRPDIAAAERRVAAANAELGVANAAFFPDLTLSAVTGFESSSIGKWFTGLSNFWTTGPQMLYTIFDAGRRRAISAEAQAGYEESVASYRQTVLVAFREVEDQLAALRILDDEAAVQAKAVDAAERALALANNRYRGGVTSYLEVTVAQSAALANERVAADILTRRVNATVLLVKALGGGWTGGAAGLIKAAS